MRELEKLEKRLQPLFKDKLPQVWLGDYNRCFIQINPTKDKGKDRDKVIIRRASLFEVGQLLSQ